MNDFLEKSRKTVDESVEKIKIKTMDMAKLFQDLSNQELYSLINGEVIGYSLINGDIIGWKIEGLLKSIFEHLETKDLLKKNI